MTAPTITPAPEGTESSAARTRRDRYQKLQLILFTGGAVLMPAGVIAVGLGWYGAANAKYAYDQFPYLLSGGLLGVCLTTVGGFLYFGAWQAKAAADQRSGLKQLAETVRVLADTLAQQHRDESFPGLAGSSDPGAVRVVAGDSGASIHRRDCRLISHREDLRLVTEAEVGLTICRVCKPEPV